MKFICEVQRQEGGDPWLEKYDKPHVKSHSDAQRWAESTIAYFNATLREHEKPRKLLCVRIDSERSDVHSWVKQNLTTIVNRFGIYDVLECEICGVRGKRFGLSGNIKLDSQFRAKKYQKCRPSR